MHTSWFTKATSSCLMRSWWPCGRHPTTATAVETSPPSWSSRMSTGESPSCSAPSQTRSVSYPPAQPPPTFSNYKCQCSISHLYLYAKYFFFKWWRLNLYTAVVSCIAPISFAPHSVCYKYLQELIFFFFFFFNKMFNVFHYGLTYATEANQTFKKKIKHFRWVVSACVVISQ